MREKKWHRERRNIQMGEVVPINSPDTPRGSWPMGRVVESYPGDDGQVRLLKSRLGRVP